MATLISVRKNGNFYKAKIKQNLNEKNIMRMEDQKNV